MTGRRTTIRGRETKAAFEAAARKVIAEKGFLNMTVADIARESGRSAASFYNYYDSKEDLLAHWAGEFRADARTRGAGAFERGLSNRDRVSLGARAHVETYRDHLAEMVGVFQLAMVNADFAKYWQELCEEAISGIAAMITRAQSDGFCPGVDPWQSATAIVAMLNHYCYEHYSAGGVANGVGDEEVIATVTEIWFRAVYWKV
ncbi:TetR/AcrR family transcriptional regulator [Tomitella biformata]|uniref:TetR/AcrR family transcriptional regulator n=1 Tax=Tomitella biformata TaxID=630403 RepID=UPI00046539E6|nr:TetR/AcrR family transcriptional regulator [Tomitella biformata]